MLHKSKMSCFSLILDKCIFVSLNVLLFQFPTFFFHGALIIVYAKFYFYIFSHFS